MVSRDHIVAALYQSRRYEAAIDAARLMIRMPPDHPPSDSWFAVAPGQFAGWMRQGPSFEGAIAIGLASFDMYVRKRALFGD
jgi:hypothetical protein